MKKTATAPEPSDERPRDDGWRPALALLEQDLRRRGAAEKTRHAYAVDARQFVHWAAAQRLAPDAVTPRLLRRYAAGLDRGGAGAEHRRAQARVAAGAVPHARRARRCWSRTPPTCCRRRAAASGCRAC